MMQARCRSIVAAAVALIACLGIGSVLATALGPGSSRVASQSSVASRAIDGYDRPGRSTTRSAAALGAALRVYDDAARPSHVGIAWVPGRLAPEGAATVLDAAEFAGRHPPR